LRTLGAAGTLGLIALSVLAFVGNRALIASADAYDKEDWALAEAQARTAIRWTPWSGTPWLALGEAQLARGDPAAARGSFRRGLGQDDRDWELWFDLALASRGGERGGALARAARLNPQAPELRDFRRLSGSPGTPQGG
jgi:hypothetical protein